MLFLVGTFRDKDSDLVPLSEHWFETKDNATVSCKRNYENDVGKWAVLLYVKNYWTKPEVLGQSISGQSIE